MADKQRGFIADNIRVAPKRSGTEVKAITLMIDDQGMKDSRIAKSNARLIFYAIGNGFDWGGTEEGHGYWSTVADALYRISQKGR